jgi:hypothetical protein
MWDQWWEAERGKLNIVPRLCRMKLWRFYTLSFASDAGMSRLLLEMDAITIRTALTSNAYDLSPIGMIIRDIKYRMLTEFIEE